MAAPAADRRDGGPVADAPTGTGLPLPAGATALARLSGSVGVVPEPDAEGPTEGDALLEPLVRDGEVVATFDLEAAVERARSEARAVGFRDHPDRTA